jgi:hypothetical protein
MRCEILDMRPVKSVKPKAESKKNNLSHSECYVMKISNLKSQISYLQ